MLIEEMIRLSFVGGGLGDQLECLAQLCDPCMKVWYSRLHLHLPVQSSNIGSFSEELADQALDGATSGNPSGENQDRWLSRSDGLAFLLIPV